MGICLVAMCACRAQPGSIDARAATRATIHAVHLHGGKLLTAFVDDDPSDNEDSDDDDVAPVATVPVTSSSAPRPAQRPPPFLPIRAFRSREERPLVERPPAA
jgi:hypothetical protein